MKLIQQSYEILRCPTREEALRDIARAARVCYQSNGKKTDAEIVRQLMSATPFPHTAMIEHAGTIMVELVASIGEMREAIRHRLSSFAQESTRYCAYDGKRFDAQMTFVTPNDWSDRSSAQKLLWLAQMKLSEVFYLTRRGLGEKAERARDGIPLAARGTLILTANMRQWATVIIPLRTDSHAHPQLRALITDIKNDLATRIPEVFGE